MSEKRLSVAVLCGPCSIKNGKGEFFFFFYRKAAGRTVQKKSMKALLLLSVTIAFLRQRPTPIPSVFPGFEHHLPWRFIDHPIAINGEDIQQYSCLGWSRILCACLKNDDFIVLYPLCHCSTAVVKIVNVTFSISEKFKNSKKEQITERECKSFVGKKKNHCYITVRSGYK